MRNGVLWIVIVFLVSCVNKAPDILQPQKMQVVFWDVIRSDVYNSDYRSDTTKTLLNDNIVLQNKIFNKHGVTRELFYKSFEYYTNHPEKMTLILDSMMVQEDRRRNNLTSKQIK